MEAPASLELTLGSKTHQVRTLNLLQQRAVGTAWFNAPAPPPDPNDPTKVDLTKFDFDAEFDSAARIVFAALNREDPSAPHLKWLAEIDASYQDLQTAKADVLKYAGYMKDRPAAAAAAVPDPSSV